MLQFVIAAVRENNRGSVDRISNWTLPISGEISGSFPDTEGDTWFYATLDTPITYTMPSGMGVSNGSSPTQVTDVVLRPFYLDENPALGMRAFPMDFAVVLDPEMRESGVIDVNLVDFIAVVEVDDAAMHGEIPAVAADVDPPVEEPQLVEDPKPEPEPDDLKDVTIPAQDLPETEAEVFSAAGEMQPDPRGPVTIPQVDLSTFSQEMELSESAAEEEPSPEELPPGIPQEGPLTFIPQVDLSPTVPQVDLHPTGPQEAPPTFVPPAELPPVIPQAEIPEVIPQAAPPTFVPQVELPPTVPQAEIPEVIPQADLSDFVPAPKPPPAPRRVIEQPRPVREEVVFSDVAERTPRNTGPLKLAAAAAAVLALGGLGFSTVFSSSGDAEEPVAQTESTTETTTSSASIPPPPPLPSPEDLARVSRGLPAGYTPDSCPPKAIVEAGGVASLACGRNNDPGGPLSGIYTVFGDRTTLNETFDRAVYASTQKICPGNMQSPGPWRRNATPERESGVLFCGTRGETPVIIWSDVERLQLATVLGSPGGPNLDELYGWWTQHS